MFAKLVALNEEARRALNGVQIEIERFPFKVGRESRGFLSRASMSIERRLGSASPLNDVYLSASAADGPRISREHFLIDRTPEGHYLVDRASTDGTVVNGVRVGGGRSGGRVELQDQAVISVGPEVSGFVFRFVIA